MGRSADPMRSLRCTRLQSPSIALCFPGSPQMLPSSLAQMTRAPSRSARSRRALQQRCLCSPGRAVFQFLNFYSCLDRECMGSVFAPRSSSS